MSITKNSKGFLNFKSIVALKNQIIRFKELWLLYLSVRGKEKYAGEVRKGTKFLTKRKTRRNDGQGQKGFC